MNSINYAFAHRVVRKFAEKGQAFFRIMNSEHGQNELLTLMWSLACKYVNDADENDEKIEVPPIHVKNLHINGYPAIIIGLPPPYKIADAIFIAIVDVSNLHERQENSSEHQSVRYITLELSFGFNESNAVLCEWMGENHLNYACGTAATESDFINAVEELIA